MGFLKEFAVGAGVSVLGMVVLAALRPGWRRLLRWWRCHVAPELWRVQDAGQRDKIWQAARESTTVWHWNTALVLGGVAAIVGGVVLAGLTFPVSLALTTGVCLAVALYILLAVYVAARLVRRDVIPAVRLEMTKRGLPTCVACGNDLTDSGDGPCARCGELPVPDTCEACTGRGFVDRRGLLGIAIALLILGVGLHIPMAIGPLPLRHGGSLRSLWLVLVAPPLLVGLGVLASYVIKGSRPRCEVCGGEGILPLNADVRPEMASMRFLNACVQEHWQAALAFCPDQETADHVMSELGGLEILELREMQEVTIGRQWRCPCRVKLKTGQNHDVELLLVRDKEQDRYRVDYRIEQ